MKNLIGAIETCIDRLERTLRTREPFVWTRTADEIIGKINRKRTHATRH